ncbi:hypothetical protein KVR01_006832 [Diaporthe batatas]|uniref:uncharacterized protein n=1 Tax=Diaporthe batatas TaxID=748121 RepID=UPI001D03A859|nr:uncharacterized protein KVR01_006832 [Diaporthe batatas]KAG8163535.1 hypothetical protein KVR01_006832 [Diaporthe batatas]
MLRRPPTVLTLTSEDVKAYEDHREAEAFQHATAAAQLRRQQQLSRNMSGMDITGMTTSSDDEDYSEQDASYYPNRTYSQNPRVSRENIEGPLDSGIFRNEEDPDDYQDASDGGLAQQEGFIEDLHMPEAGQMDLDAEQTDNDDNSDIPGAAVPNLHHTQPQQPQQQQQSMFPSPPPAPPRLTRSTRSASTELSSSQAHQQQAHAGRPPRGPGAAQTHRRAPSGRAPAADATTPTPAAETVRSRTTRSRDERIGVARGGRR